MYKKLLVLSALSVNLFGGVENATAGYCACRDKTTGMLSDTTPEVANCAKCESACTMLEPEGTYEVAPGDYCKD